MGGMHEKSPAKVAVVDELADVVLTHHGCHKEANAVLEPLLPGVAFAEGPCLRRANFLKAGAEKNWDLTKALPVREGVVNALADDLGVPFAITAFTWSIGWRLELDAQGDIGSRPLGWIARDRDGVNAKALAGGVRAPVLQVDVEVRR